MKTTKKQLDTWIAKNYTTKKPTVYEIKRWTCEDSPYFFSRNTMRFFKQKLSDFKIERTDEPNKFLVSARSLGGNTTERYFIFTDYNMGELLTV